MIEGEAEGAHAGMRLLLSGIWQRPIKGVYKCGLKSGSTRGRPQFFDSNGEDKNDMV